MTSCLLSSCGFPFHNNKMVPASPSGTTQAVEEGSSSRLPPKEITSSLGTRNARRSNRMTTTVSQSSPESTDNRSRVKSESNSILMRPAASTCENPEKIDGGARGPAAAVATKGTATEATGGVSTYEEKGISGSASTAKLPAGGRLPRGVSFKCDEMLPEEKETSKIGSTSASASKNNLTNNDGSRSITAITGGGKGSDVTTTTTNGGGGRGPRRTLSGILRTETSGVGGGLSAAAGGGAAGGGVGVVSTSGETKGGSSSSSLTSRSTTTRHPMKSCVSLTPRMMENTYESSSTDQERGRRKSLSGTVETTSDNAARYGEWIDIRGGNSTSTPGGGSSDAGGGMGGRSSAFCAGGAGYRSHIRHGRHTVGPRSPPPLVDSNNNMLLPAAFAKHRTVGGPNIGNIVGGGGIDECNPLSAGLGYRRRHAWARVSRQIGIGGGGSKGVVKGRTTSRTCSDSHLGPQQQHFQPYLRHRMTHQNSGAGGQGGVLSRPAASGGAGGGGGTSTSGERISSGGNFTYYGRSRSSQQYFGGRSAGSLWPSRYSWLPVFSGGASYVGEELLKYGDRGKQRYLLKKHIVRATHAAAICVAKHAQIGATYGFYPLCSARFLLWLCLFGSMYFLSIGLWLLVEDENYLECKLNYESKGPQNGGSRYLLERITPDMCGTRGGGDITHIPGPIIHVYVEMEQVYQNDAQILWSRSLRQLAGEIITDPAELKECEPYVTAEVENKTKVLHPCGALAWNVLTDYFQFLEGPDDDDDDQPAQNPIFLDQSQDVVLDAYTGWENSYRNPSKAERAKYTDLVYFWMSPEDNDIYANPNLAKEHARAELTADRLQYAEAGSMVENGHFIQWMTVGALGQWRKLYGRLTGPLKLPLYAYISSVYDVSTWGGKKALVLVQHTNFGGRTLFVGIMYVVLGCILVILSVWLGWKNWHQARGETDASADLRWQGRKKSLRKFK